MAARLHASGDRDVLGSLMLRSIRLSLLGGGILGLCLGLFAPELLGLWLGADLMAAAPILRILLLAMVASVPQLVSSGLLTMTGDHRFTGRIAAASAATNILLSVSLALVFGVVGIAVATLACTLIFDVFVITTRACRRFSVPSRDLKRTVIHPVGLSLSVGLLAGAFAKWLLAPDAWVELLISFGLVAGTSLVTFSRYLDPIERCWLLGVLGRLRTPGKSPGHSNKTPVVPGEPA